MAVIAIVISVRVWPSMTKKFNGEDPKMRRLTRKIKKMESSLAAKTLCVARKIQFDSLLRAVV